MTLPSTLAGLKGADVAITKERVSSIDTTSSLHLFTVSGGKKVPMIDDGETIQEGDLVLVIRVGNRAYGLGKLRGA